jgi:hypothetical protein
MEKFRKGNKVEYSGSAATVLRKIRGLKSAYTIRSGGKQFNVLGRDLKKRAK